MPRDARAAQDESSVGPTEGCVEDTTMKYSTSSWVSLLMVAIAILGLTTCVYVAAHDKRAAWEGVETGWIANRADCICGLDELRLLSNPARIDHHRAMMQTPEMKKLIEENIDPASPLGIQLRMLAVDRVRSVADVVRVQGGHCSVWKRISHRDGRTVPDLTAAVIARLGP